MAKHGIFVVMPEPDLRQILKFCKMQNWLADGAQEVRAASAKLSVDIAYKVEFLVCALCGADRESVSALSRFVTSMKNLPLVAEARVIIVAAAGANTPDIPYIDTILPWPISLPTLRGIVTDGDDIEIETGNIFTPGFKLRQHLRNYEEGLVLAALRKSNNSATQAAKILGVQPRAVRKYRKEAVEPSVEEEFFQDKSAPPESRRARRKTPPPLPSLAAKATAAHTPGPASLPESDGIDIEDSGDD